MSETQVTKSYFNWPNILLLAFGVGAIYMLPYVRNTYYDALIVGLGVTNTELGMITGFFGLLTIVCYFPGGWLADIFSAKKLLVVSFMANAALGVWYSTLPPFKVVLFIHVLFGIFCTLTFWAAFVKANRLCASADLQGKAYGFVEGLRRVVSTCAALGGSWLLGRTADQVGGLQHALLFYSAICFIVGVLIFFFLKEVSAEEGGKTGASLKDIAKTARIPEVWMIAFIIFLTYTSYRSQDVMTPYTTNLCGLSGSLAAVVASIRYYGLGFMAIPGGLIGDKIGFSTAMICGYVIVIITNVLMLLFPGTPATLYTFIIIMLTFMVAHFAMRGIFYALYTEGMVPTSATGIATGIVATIAYSPDFFAPIYQGYLLDLYGVDNHTGYNIIFMISIGVSVLGILLCLWFKRRVAVKRLNAELNVY